MSFHQHHTLAEGVTVTGPRPYVSSTGGNMAISVIGKTTSGSGSLVVLIEVTNSPDPVDENDWITAGSVSLALSTTRQKDGFNTVAPWKKWRANITTISGTGAQAFVYLTEAR